MATAAAVAVAMTMFNSGCSGPEESRPGGDQFTGPWAQELRTAYETSQSELEKQVLEDGRITDAENSELLKAYQQCVTDLGFELTWEGDEGGFSIPGEEQPSEEALAKCTDATEGDAAMLYREMRRNPENINESEIMAACLVRIGLVDASYTAQDYESDFNSNPSPALFDDQKFNDCNADPLGAGR